MRRVDHPDALRREGGSERSHLDPFVVATGDASPRDQRDLPGGELAVDIPGQRLAFLLQARDLLGDVDRGLALDIDLISEDREEN